MGALKKDISFREILIKLCDFWNNFGCTLIPPAQTEISSPLFHPNSFFGMIDDNNIDTMYFQPHVASMDSKGVRYNMQNYSLLKFQVVLKSEVKMPQKIFLDSLLSLGLNHRNNDIVFENVVFDNFIFRLNAVGYQVFFNSTSIAKIYYIQNIGCCDSGYIPITISYDIDKILTVMQGCDNIWDVSWNGRSGEDKISYNDVMFFSEKENYDFIVSDSTNEVIFRELENYKDMAVNLIENGIILPAYISILKAKYCLDILNIRNYITYNNKISYNKILRDLVDLCCEKYNRNKNISE